MNPGTPQTPVWVWLPNVITGLTLIVLFVTLLVMRNQSTQASRQFVQLNQGYLDVQPHLDLSIDNLDHTIAVGPDRVIKPEATFNAYNYYVLLKNIGHLPIRYEVKAFDLWVNDESYSTPFKSTDNVSGILYPSQETTFRRPSAYFDKLQHRAIPFADIQKLKVRATLKIEYSGTNESTRLVDRSWSWRLIGNIADLSWDGLNDKW